jgi:hypothetical protein
VVKDKRIEFLEKENRALREACKAFLGFSFEDFGFWEAEFDDDWIIIRRYREVRAGQPALAGTADRGAGQEP